MATIKAIDGRSVHQIQSGQVITDLISVVKELVENGLDAGATSIDIRFKNYGLDSIEVQDNGNGIAPEDFETVALKHYTSKLSAFEDLDSLNTFGFRGEALSSLCALSNFRIVTARAVDGSVGRKLEFANSGKLEGNVIVAAQKGTTVTVENLFASLPVRRKELDKNIKREYNKALVSLYAYACISVGVRFSVSNQMPKAKKIPVFSTKANPTTKENIANVFGAKTLQSLVSLDLRLEMQPSDGPSTQSTRLLSSTARHDSIEVSVQGHISKPVFGEGRQAPDRQMLFVNSRPCLLPQISKAFNEVYRSFNVSQTPFVFANLVMDTNAYDVNVSPDKRTIMLHDQTALLESLKRSLTRLFEQSDYTVPQSTLSNDKLPSYKPLTIPQRSVSQDEPSSDAADSEEELESSEIGLSGETPRSGARNGDKSVQSVSVIENWVGQGTMLRDKIGATAPKVQRSILHDKQEVEAGEGLTSNGRPKSVDLNGGLPGFVRPSIDMDGTERSHPPFNIRKDRSSDESRTGIASAEANVNSDGSGTPVEVLDPKEDEAEETTTSMNVGIESPVPAITPSSQHKTTSGAIQNAFDRMRPRRTPLQSAEITIGSTTTTTVIGSGRPFKKRRIHQPVHSQSITHFGSSPLLSRGLSTFAAPGSQLEADGNEALEAEPVSSSIGSDEGEESATEVPREGSQEEVSNDSRDESDEEYLDEKEKKIREDEKVARLIRQAEVAAAQPTEANLRRASQVFKNTGNRKDSPLQLMQLVDTSVDDFRKQISRGAIGLGDVYMQSNSNQTANAVVKDEIADSNAESRLSLTVTKSDFEKMEIVGQFNLGFILAIRPAMEGKDEDELFIIDQHAADEKYNYERLQRTVRLQSQRLVHPKQLDLTAVEEEIILNHVDALKANGFEIEMTSDAAEEEEVLSVRRQCRLLTLPMSREKTFEISDLEELLHLLSEAPAGSTEIPRPKKVQSMLAMRACRSSIMVGKTLTIRQMEKVVRHMGEMEKPWNCPHGRPTMRHLAGLGAWRGWREGQGLGEDEGAKTDWRAFLEGSEV